MGNSVLVDRPERPPTPARRLERVEIEFGEHLAIARRLGARSPAGGIGLAAPEPVDAAARPRRVRAVLDERRLDQRKILETIDALHEGILVEHARPAADVRLRHCAPPADSFAPPSASLMPLMPAAKVSGAGRSSGSGVQSGRAAGAGSTSVSVAAACDTAA